MKEKTNDIASPARSTADDSTESRAEADTSLRIGAEHGADTDLDRKTGYARDIGPEGAGTESGEEARTKESGLTYSGKLHPSRRLELRSRGYGIGGGYERPYKKEKVKEADSRERQYGPIPHSGYYGSGTSERPFKLGQASFQDEMGWYRNQYGENTTSFEKKK